MSDPLSPLHDRLIYGAYVGMAAIAGAIVSLSFGQWQKMTRGEVGMALFVGFSFAIFAVPYLVVDVLKINSFLVGLRVAGGTSFFGSAFAGYFLPKIRRRLEKMFGFTDDGEKP